MKQYSAKAVTLSVANILIDSGFADGDFIAIEQVEDDTTEYVGTDGEVTVAPTNNTLTKVTVTLAQSSDGNAKLTALRALGKASPTGVATGPLLIKDRNGTSLHAATYCWIKKPPDVTYSREVKERNWTIMCQMDERIDGGN